MRSPQTHRGEMTQELERESPAHCTVGTSGYKANLTCMLEKESHGILYKKPRMGRGKTKKMMSSLLKI